MHHTFGQCEACPQTFSPVNQWVPLFSLPGNQFFRGRGTITNHVRTGKAQDIFKHCLRILRDTIDGCVYQTCGWHFGRVNNLFLQTELFSDDFSSGCCGQEQNSTCRSFDRAAIQMHSKTAFDFRNLSLFVKTFRQRRPHQLLRAGHRVFLGNRHFGLWVAQSVAHYHISSSYSYRVAINYETKASISCRIAWSSSGLFRT